MKIFLLGATGGIGRHLWQTAHERGHQVTAYVRSPQKLESSHAWLKVVPGDVFDADQMAHELAGHDLVLSAFGPLTIRASTLRRQFGRTLATASRLSGVRRIQLVSAAFLFQNVGISGRILKATLFRQMIPDMAGMEAEVCQNDLDWTIVRPPRLTHGRARHAYRVAAGRLPEGGFIISRADVAHFMIGEAENPKHLKQIVGVAN